MDAETIAKGLSKAQRKTLLENRRCVASYRPAQKLVEMGLWDDRRDEFTIYSSLTPLGHTVREILLRDQ